MKQFFNDLRKVFIKIKEIKEDKFALRGGIIFVSLFIWACIIFPGIVKGWVTFEQGVFGIVILFILGIINCLMAKVCEENKC
jgi:hypothetical protein